ncbi:hypothetical protein CUMW_272120 [Citrus unshiu]|uniref:Nucleolar protein 58/56 N-terminal domain-containing protein n=2 Tax=Citrus TaxID=2706 RepID=A0A067DD39_CITSI|nr:hypothetical protein CISIN_1g046512mg [Citrus sinensis]GAY69450.1 hypothetical protein CUMW_272120 [Citrus unshiu]
MGSKSMLLQQLAAASIALYLLYETASNYSLFLVYGLDQIGQNTKAVRSSIFDLNCFSKVLHFMAFHPF